MEDQLKARLIGASVLVLLAVLLIPELLSARKPAADAIGSAKTSRGTRTYTINLGDAVSAGARLEPAPAAAKPLPATRAPAVEPTVEDSDPSPPDEAATPAASPAANPAATRPATSPASTAVASTVPPKPKPESVPAPTPAVPVTNPAPAKGQWTVQVGAFSSAKSADKLIGDLRRDGYSAYEAPLSRAGKTLHRVRVGPEAERAAADRLSARLKERGLPATVVTND